MTRFRWFVVAMVLGVSVGATTALVRSPTDPHTAIATSTAPTFAPLSAPRAAATPPPATADPAVAPPAAPEILLAWMSNAIPPAAVESIRHDASIAAITAVARDETGLIGVDAPGTASWHGHDGFAIPVDVLAFDATYADLVPVSAASTFWSLRADQALLGATGARVRGVGVGASLTMGHGVTVDVVGIVDDALVGAAEVVVTAATGARLGIDQVRYLLLSHRGSRADAEAVVHRVVTTPIRFRAPGETPFLRDADAVLPLSAVKLLFGEFAYRPTATGLEQDPAWMVANIVEAEVPILGRVRCHARVLDALRGALDQLEHEQLSYLVDPAMSQVCWRLGSIHLQPRLSRQAWGIGLQLNNAKNPTGSGSVQDHRLIEIMQRWGFAWGGDWLIAEPSYFEYIGPPRTT